MGAGSGGSRTITIKFDGTAKGLVSSAEAAALAVKKVGDDTSGFKKAEAAADDLSKKLDQQAKDSKEKGSLIGGGLALGLSAAAPLVAGALIGGVSLGFIGAAALVQKNNKQVQDSFGDLKNQVVTEMTSASDQVVPYLVKSGHALQQEFANLRPQLDTIFKSAGPDVTILTSGVDKLADNAMPGLVRSMQNSKPIVTGISVVLGDLGTTSTTVLDDLSSHSQEFGNDLNQVGTLITNVGAVAGGVLPGLASGFGTTVGTANALLSAVKPIAPALGTVTGEVLPAVGAFKLFGLATSPLDKLGSKVAGAAGNFGRFTKSVTGSTTAATKVTSAASKVGSALGKVGSALPIVGAGFALLGDVISAADEQQQQLVSDLDKGGTVGQNATNKLISQAEAAAKAQTTQANSTNYLAAQEGLATDADTRQGNAKQLFTDKINSLTKGYDPLTAATVRYNAELAANTNKSDGVQFSATQLAAAQKTLAAASDNAQQSQENLARSAQDVSVKLQGELTGTLNLISAQDSLLGSQLDIDDAQKTYSAAVKQFGGNSEQAKRALIGLDDALVSDVTNAGKAATAIDEKAKADGKSISPAQEAADANRAQTTEVNRLIQSYAASGKTIPAALLRTANGLHDTGVSASVAAGDVQGVNDKLKATKGKTVTVNALTQSAITQLTNLGFKITKLPNGKFTVTPNDAAALAALRELEKPHKTTLTIQAKIVGATGLGSHAQLSGKAEGGPVKANTPYVVGESGKEVFVPEQNGTIIPHDKLNNRLGGSTDGAAGAGIGGDTFDLVFADEVLLSIIDGRLRSFNRTLVSKVKAGASR